MTPRLSESVSAKSHRDFLNSGKVRLGVFSRIHRNPCCRCFVHFFPALVFFFCAVSSFPVSAADEEKSKPERVFLDFSGMPEPGTAFLFRIRSIRTRNCEIKIMGMEDHPPVRRDTREVLAAGQLFYKAKRMESGMLIRELEFTSDSIYGFINGKRFDYPEFSGKTFHIVISDKDTSIRLKNQGGKTDPAASLSSNVLSGKDVRSSDGEIPPELLYFLKAIFGSASDSPMNYLGKSAWMERGRHFTPDPTPVAHTSTRTSSAHI